MGLLRGMARTAVVAGTATAVSNNVSRRQAERWYGDQTQAAPAPSTQETGDDPYAELEKLGALKDRGVISQEDFDAKKKQLLGI